ncbi:vacuolar ATP synthase subunit H [Heterostelium album PN500]|uniref:Vacuolar ATP synthase subunit H n=1 Tax=Heterostelium pallidum (strain ATCC 26659 / Pp 5 / PN500) TaxID=670386 RepID=D3BF90_HETP5|nr:vacuolar ATP synthase subunit H [Heterostelium album PN500]EFA79804.1 vacuolar ATP synthase subunit H [Heterostelium album PN500]|eukprot:XP_020431925.1 vacuolar ATP synthase subunit H [Heterostelium album PN500]
MRFEEEFLKHTVNGVKAAEAAFRDQKVATRIVPWSSHLKSDFITREEYSLIDKYDKKSETEKKTIFSTEGDRLAQFFVDFLQKSADLDTIQYVLYLVNEIIRIEPKALNNFVRLNSAKDANYPYNIFFRLFNREDNNAYVNLIAGIILGNILAAGSPPQKEIEHFINWSLPLLRKSEPREVEVALIALQAFLAKEDNRVLFNKLQGTNLLVEIVSNNASPNTLLLPLLYEALYCIWLLSFSPVVAHDASEKNIVPTLVQITKTITKEKIIRLSIASLRVIIKFAKQIPPYSYN